MSDYLVFAFLISTVPVFSQVPEWYNKLTQIQVSKSTRRDVERIFDFPKIEQIRKGKGSTGVDYVINEDGQVLSVYYSTARCDQEDNQNGYNLDEGTVIRVYLLLFEPIKLSTLKINLKGFDKFKASGTNAWVYYNDDLSIEYTVYKKKISSIEYKISPKKSL